MSPGTHLLASWLIAAKATKSIRDCRLVAWAGLLPDADGLGLLVDWINQGLFHRSTSYYSLYHHSLLHGIVGAVVISGIMAAFARQRLRVAFLSFVIVHLHLLCDWLGSRGPDPGDYWPIYYFSPIRNHPVWRWHGQWALDGWQNQLINTVLLVVCLALAVRRGRSFVGLFSTRWDRIFVGVLKKWSNSVALKLTARTSSEVADI
ncbi:MAG TPA: metal-dependent hydrolase [Candidatus Limnocylindria bacterium]|jgi:hypothetical protein|nr:metal-dependent hydrolase [Candidatus Limnocylindria bacterium]